MSAITRNGMRRRSDEVQYRLIYLATLPAFLISVGLMRLIGAGSGMRARPQSFLGEVKAAAQTCGSLSLMG